MKQVICTVILMLATTVASAQSDDVPRYEVGALFSSVTIKEPNAFDLMNGNSFRTEPGIGGRFTYNITDSVAAEAEATFFPNDNGSFNQYAAGRATQVLFGIKAGKRFKQFGVFGKARPGFLHFSKRLFPPTPTAPINLELGGRTNFAIDIGGVLEFYPSRRIVTRFDIGDTIIRYNGLSYEFPCPQPASPTPCSPAIVKVTIPARVKHNLQFTVGVGLRFGGSSPLSEPVPAHSRKDRVRRYEVGTHFSSFRVVEPNQFSIPRFTENTSRTEPGVGGRFTYNITDSLAAEAEVTFFPNDNGSFDTYTAGRTTQGLFGVKAGKRFERFGIFGKARPGFARFSRALRGTRSVVTVTNPNFQEFDYSGRTNFALDVGGVIEFYPSRRLVTRFDIGDTIIRYNELNFTLGPPGAAFTAVVHGRTQNNLQFNAGVGIRF